MKVICDNCRAVYKIPDEKLNKPVNKATCRKCGHRMLIPRPRQGASPDEKTLVTAVPPTPQPAPGREVAAYQHEELTEDEPENTLPGLPPAPARPRQPLPAAPLVIDDVPLYSATPLAAPDRDAGPMYARGASPPGSDLNFSGNTPAPAPRSQGNPRAPEPPRSRTPAPSSRTVPPPTARQAPPPPPPPPPEPPRPIDPLPELGRISPSDDIMPNLRKAATPIAAPPRQPAHSLQPTPSSPGSSAGVAHDPAGDITLALLSTVGTMAGALVLVVAFFTMTDALPTATLLVLFVGMLLAFGGGTSTVLVLLTGNRGRRPSRPIVSVGLAAVISMFVTTSTVGLFVLRDQFLSGGEEGPPLAAVTRAPPDEALVREPEPPPIDVPPPLEPEVEPPTPNEKPPPKPPRNGGPAIEPEQFAPRPIIPTGNPSPPARDPDPDPGGEIDLSAENIEPPPPPKPNLPASVSDDVIDTILRNNLELKKCFFNHKKATGELPARVTVAFQLEPSGDIHDAGVTDPAYQGLDLESCLSRVINGIQMPPSSGVSRRVKYPFQLQ